MRKIVNNWDYTPSVGELIDSSDCKVETAGVLSVSQQYEMLLKAGEQLDDFRKMRFDLNAQLQVEAGIPVADKYTDRVDLYRKGLDLADKIAKVKRERSSKANQPDKEKSSVEPTEPLNSAPQGGAES